jgi:hypothetical protein
MESLEVRAYRLQSAPISKMLMRVQIIFSMHFPAEFALDTRYICTCLRLLFSNLRFISTSTWIGISQFGYVLRKQLRLIGHGWTRGRRRGEFMTWEWEEDAKKSMEEKAGPGVVVWLKKIAHGQKKNSKDWLRTPCTVLIGHGGRDFFSARLKRRV